MVTGFGNPLKSKGKKAIDSRPISAGESFANDEELKRTPYRATVDKLSNNATVPILNLAVPHLAGTVLKTLLGLTVALYVLNERKYLPRPLSAVVSKTLFVPTLPITFSKRIGKWVTRIDDTVLMGGAPFMKYPETLYGEHNVRAVINLCEEYRGPIRKYKQMGIEQLHLPTTDHFEPSLDDLKTAIRFIRKYQAKGKCVYVHCKAGHGRSGAAVFGWLLYKDPIVDPESLNSDFCQLRDVRKTLWKQANIRRLHAQLLENETNIPENEIDGDTDDMPLPKLTDDVDD